MLTKYHIFSTMQFLRILLLISLLTVGQAWGQSAKYWISFYTKDTVGYDPSRHLSARTLANRQLLGLPAWQYSDIPVSSSHLAALRAVGIRPENTSRWLNAASAHLSPGQVELLRAMDFVASVTPVRQGGQVSRYSEEEVLAYATAVSQMQPERFKDAALDGTGVTIGVIDGGFFGATQNEYLQQLFDGGKILGIRDFVNPGKADHYNDRETSLDYHGTAVLQMISGQKEGEVQLGLATGSHFYLARTDHGSNEFRGEEDYWIAAIEWMDSLGVRLINTSLGYATGFDDPAENYTPDQMNGKTTKITQAAQKAFDEKGMLIVVSAGNEGNNRNWQIVSAPADAKGVLSVGATNTTGLKAGYSSTGAAHLPYLKPNVSCYAMSGTSFAAPVITGFIACLLQHKPEASAAELFSVTEQAGSLYPFGNTFVGYGIPQASKALSLLNGQTPTNSHRTLQAAGQTEVKIQANNNQQKKALLFHKSSELLADSQRELTAEKNVFVVKKTSEATRTTVIIGEEVIEIIW